MRLIVVRLGPALQHCCFNSKSFEYFLTSKPQFYSPLMSHSACSHFRPNFWRPTICAYCYRPKVKHYRSREGLRQGAMEWENDEFMIPRAATISTGSPTALRERRKLRSEPPADGLGEEEPCTSGDKRVGVVKPYAVVELNETWARENGLSRKTSFTILPQIPYGMDNDLISPPSLARQRVASCTTLTFAGSNSHRPLTSSNQTSSPLNQKRKIVPKRKAPPPPDKQSKTRTSRSFSVPNQPFTITQEDTPPPSVQTEEKVTSNQTHNSQLLKTSVDQGNLKERSPPCKPPRTKSTFLMPDAPMGYSIRDQTVPSPYTLTQLVGDYEPLRRPALTQICQPDIPVSPSLFQQLQDVFNETLSVIAVKHLRELVAPEELWGMEWSDITVSVDSDNQHQFHYRMQPITLEPLQDMHHSVELEIAKAVGPHLNLSLAQGILPQAPIDYIDVLPDAVKYVVRETQPGVTSIQTVLPLWRGTLTDEDYMQCVLLILIQVLRALKYLYCNGVVHRDIGVDSLTAWTHQDDCIIKLGNFQYALHRQGPISATTFVYAYHELSWLGGVESHLPPEILDTPNNVNTLDYSHTDSFAVGCLIYELIAGESPFDQDPQLVYRHYSDTDLPGFSNNSRMSLHLERLAQLLLRHEPLKRLGINDALLVVQSLLWLPHSWLEQCISKKDIEDHLIYLKATLLAQLAQKDTTEPVALETLLKAEFLASCSSSDLVRTLSVFKH